MKFSTKVLLQDFGSNPIIVDMENNHMSIATIAGEVRKSMNPTSDNFEIGQQVAARFTNSGWTHQFTGVIVGRTKNYWKVQTVTSPYESEAPGWVFHIATLESRIYSANNRIVAVSL